MNEKQNHCAGCKCIICTYEQMTTRKQRAFYKHIIASLVSTVLFQISSFSSISSLSAFGFQVILSLSLSFVFFQKKRLFSLPFTLQFCSYRFHSIHSIRRHLFCPKILLNGLWAEFAKTRHVQEYRQSTNLLHSSTRSSLSLLSLLLFFMPLFKPFYESTHYL